MSEEKKLTIDEYPSYVAGTIHGGPLVVIDRLIPRLSEAFFRLRANAELLNNHLPFDDEACRIHNRVMAQIREIEKEVLLFEETAKLTCENAMLLSESAVSKLCEKVVEANCDELLAQDSLEKCKSRISWLEKERESRLQAHNPASPDLRAKVLSLTGGKCAYCETEITSDLSDGNANFVIEHVVPKSCGGPDHFSNYVPACSKCNAQKATGHVLEFIQRKLVVNRVEIAEAAE